MSSVPVCLFIYPANGYVTFTLGRPHFPIATYIVYYIWMYLRDPVRNLWTSPHTRLLCIFSLWPLSRLTYRRAFLNFSPSLGRIISRNSCALKSQPFRVHFTRKKDARDAIRVSTTQVSRRPTFTMNWPRDMAGLTRVCWGAKAGFGARQLQRTHPARFYLWLYLSLCLCEIFVYVSSFPGNSPRFFSLCGLCVRSNRLIFISGLGPFMGPNHVPWFAVIIPQSVFRLRPCIRMWLNLMCKIEEVFGAHYKVKGCSKPT